VGQHVSPDEPLFAVVDVNDLWVTANFKETQLDDIRPGLRATVKVDAFGDSFRGQVESVGAASGARFSLLPPENATTRRHSTAPSRAPSPRPSTRWLPTAPASPT